MAYGIQTVLHLQPHMLKVSFATLQLLYQLCTDIIDKAVGEWQKRLRAYVAAGGEQFKCKM